MTKTIFLRMAGAGIGTVALLVGTASSSALAGDNEYLVNDGFEVTENTVGFLPDLYGDWQGDMSIISTAQDGIIPFEGIEMFHFQATRMDGPGLGSIGGEVWQLIDVSSFENQIRSGNATLNASAWFNRVARDGNGSGDNETDTQFRITLSAYAGSPSDFPNMWKSRSQLQYSRTDVFSDDDTETWEMAFASLPLPKNTDFVAICLSANEDIMDDGGFPEFDGHYADGAAVWLIPTPSSAALLVAGCGLGYGGWSRRRRSTARG